MKTTCSIFGLCVFTAFATINFSFSTAFAQGSLTPPGAPAPTMKTLAQIEPRTPISSLPYIISSSGSYYVTANLTGTSGANGLTIAADNVDVDLTGFTLTGVAGSGDGVSVPASQMHIAIHNGNVQGWGGFGVNGTNASNSHLDRLRAYGNTGGGLAIGNVGAIAGCEASQNGDFTLRTGDGITIGNGSSIRDCCATTNAHIGIVGGSGAVVSFCAAMFNLDCGIKLSNNCAVSVCSATQNSQKPRTSIAGGIVTGNACTVIGCTANGQFNMAVTTSPGIDTQNNSVIKDCAANGNGVGIRTGSSCNVEDCTACVNSVGAGEGIMVGDSSAVHNCVANGNTYTGILYGKSAFISDNLTAGNTVYAETTGGSNSVVIHNYFGSTNSFFIYNNRTNNAIGIIENAASLNTNKNPHANFSP